MADFTVCDTNKVSYLDIRKAMVGKSLRTVAEIKQETNVCTTCTGCETSLNWILTTVCRCRAVPIDAVVKAVKNGADTIEKIGELIKAGTDPDCGRCKVLIANILAEGK